MLSYFAWNACTSQSHYHQVTDNALRALASKLQVNVHVTVSHGEAFSRVHSPSAMWVKSVTTRDFQVCARESGIGSNGTGIINWLAFQDHPQMTRGSVSFSGIWTTETKCDKVTFSQVRRNKEIKNKTEVKPFWACSTLLRKTLDQLAKWIPPFHVEHISMLI